MNSANKCGRNFSRRFFFNFAHIGEKIKRELFIFCFLERESQIRYLAPGEKFSYYDPDEDISDPK